MTTNQFTATLEGKYSLTLNLSNDAGNEFQIAFAQFFKGEPGTDGVDGTDGTDGTNGSVWRNGSGVPSNGLGIDGDYYLDNATGNVHSKAAGVYTIVANIQGADGQDGTDGSDGTNGAVWRNGSGVPSNALGVDGDYYLDNATGNVYAKAAGVYTIATNLKGPDGTDGVDGAPGSVWRDGTGAPSNALGVNGDYYLDDANGDVYAKASGTYSVVANIQGPAGSGGGSTPFRGALVELTTNVAIPTLPYLISWNSEVYDTDNIHDNSVNPTRLTVPSGVTKVKILANALLSTHTGGLHLSLRKNGAIFSGMPAVQFDDGTGFSGNSIQIVSPVLNVVAGDYFEVRLNSTNNSLTISGSESVGKSWAAMEIVE